MTISCSIRAIGVTAAFAILAVSIFAASDSARAGTAFDEESLVNKLSQEEKQRYFIIGMLMNPLQKRQYLGIESREEREAWTARFWDDFDPSPTTSENELREEYDRRISMARELFGSEKTPGWDKRGEMIIRYGNPDFRKITEGVEGFFSKVPPGEVWYYIMLNLLVTYYDYGQDGHYDFSYEPNQRTPLQLLDNLDRFKFHLTLDPNEIDCIADPEALDRAASANEDVMEEGRVKDPNSDFYRFIKDYPTRYIPEMEQNPIPFDYALHVFGNGPDGFNVEITFEVPAGVVQFTPGGRNLESNLELRALARTITGERILLETKPLATVLSAEGRDDPEILRGQVIMPLPHGYYRLGLEVVDTQTDRRGTARTSIELPPRNDRLALSSLQFADSIERVSGQREFTKSDMLVIPNIEHTYRLPSPVLIYFEVYGLQTDENDEASFAIEYRVQPLKKKRWGFVLKKETPDITGSQDRKGHGTVRPEQLEFLTGELWEGDYRLTLTVTDTRSWESVTETVFFTMVE